jgi:hypothetical protein
MGDNTKIHQPVLRDELLADGAFAVSEAVLFTGLSRAQLYREMAAGRLAYVQCGRRRLIPRRAAQLLLAEDLRGGAGLQAASPLEPRR